MASLIPGYNYDIFVSYRQKDNKYDGWVTEFVANLKKELEATFKEEISVYFDINPSDYLLESYDVDASLQDKLKCLIFIPVLSRTYCDPKAFAWENEFKAFVEQVSNDQFGIKVKLLNGNVANRVLPIRIYDLDPSDTNYFESVLGTVLRGIDFIYSEPGVNRPLKPDDDEKINLNKTKYRNQVNKVGNAIKEIINAMLQGEQKEEEIHKKAFKPVSLPQKNRKTIIAAVSIIALVLIIFGILVIPKLFKQSEKLEKSIIVLPFKNMTGNSDQDYLVQGQNDALTTELCVISQMVKQQLRVLSGMTASAIAHTTKPIPDIANENNIDYLVEGSVFNASDSVSLQLRLVHAFPEEKLIWAGNFRSNIASLQKLYNNIAVQIAQKIGIGLTPQSLSVMPTPRQINPESYKSYLRGMFNISKDNPEAKKKGIEYLNEAIKIDPGDPFAYTALSIGYFEIAHGPQDTEGDAIMKATAAAYQAIRLDTTYAEAFLALADVNLISLLRFDEAEKNFKKAIDLNPNLAWAHFYYAWNLLLLRRNSEAVAEHEKARSLDPYNPIIAAQFSWLYNATGYPEKAVQQALKSLEISTDFDQGLAALGEAYLSLGKINEAIEIHRKLAEKYPEWIWELGYTNAISGKRSEAEKILEQINKSDLNSWNAFGRSVVNAALNNKDEAFKWLNYEPHHEWVIWASVLPYFKNLWSDPRFDEFAKRLNLPKK
jgi:TolB-like protein